MFGFRNLSKDHILSDALTQSGPLPILQAFFCPELMVYVIASYQKLLKNTMNISSMRYTLDEKYLKGNSEWLTS